MPTHCLLTGRVRPHIVHDMNHSKIESIPPAELSRDALLDELATHTFRFGRAMSALHNSLPEEETLSMPTYMLLRALDAEGPMRASDLGAWLGMKASAVSMLLQAATERGLISREHDTEDRRVIIVSLSDRGRACVAHAEEQRRTIMRQLTADLSSADLRVLLRIQRKLITAISAMEV